MGLGTAWPQPINYWKEGLEREKKSKMPSPFKAQQPKKCSVPCYDLKEKQNLGGHKVWGVGGEIKCTDWEDRWELLYHTQHLSSFFPSLFFLMFAGSGRLKFYQKQANEKPTHYAFQSSLST